MPKVVNLHHTGGLLPEDAIYIGRPGIWGNPYSIGDWSKDLDREMTREDVILIYEMTIPKYLKVKAREELKGHDLACWCAPKGCHGDVLIKIAYEEESDE